MAGVTSKDIAAQLGLSPSAVSLALNGKPGVSEATRRLIIATAEKMGLNSAKLSSAAMSRKRICFIFYVNQIVSVAENTTFSSFVLQGAETAASANSHSILVRYVRTGEPFIKQIEDIADDVDGFIILGTDITSESEPEIREFLELCQSKPVVIIDNPMSFGTADCVTNDNFGGAHMAGEYLISRGCRRIGYLRSQYRIPTFAHREAGLNMALHSAGLTLHTDLETGLSFDEAYKSVNAYLKSSPELPDAFFAENDIIAAAAIRAMNANGISVPDEISVIGFDDMPICDLSAPSLSTVHSFKEQLGEVAVNLLSQRFVSGVEDVRSGAKGLQSITVSTKLHIRKSVK